MKKILYSILALAFLLVACYREESTEWFNQVNGNHTLKAWIETSANTRTVVNEENQVVWVNGDKIGVYGDQGTVNSPFSFSKISSDGMAEFKGDLKGGETPTAVYYPYDENAAISGDELSLTLPAEYDYSANCNLPMIGVKQEDGTFRFNHLCGLLRISVVGMPKGTTQLKITSKSSDGTLPPSIAGNAVVQDIYESGAKLTMASEQSHEIIITHQADTVSGQTVFLVPMPVGQYPLLSVSLQSEDSLYFEKESTLCNIERATILNMPEISLIPDFQFAADTENNELVLFDYKNNAIVSYALKKNGLPERMRVWNAEEGSEEGNWSEISFNEDGTVESIMYDVNHIMVFSNYRKDLVDMAYYADGEITVYKEVVCDDIDWDEYKQKIAEGLADTRGFAEDWGAFKNGLITFATKYSEEIALASSSLTCAASSLTGGLATVYACGGAVKDWIIYFGKKFDPEHAAEWELLDDLNSSFVLLQFKNLIFAKDLLKNFKDYVDFTKKGYEFFELAGAEVAEFIQKALDELNNNEIDIKVSTGGSYDITATSAVLYGRITGWNNSSQGTLGFFYSTTDKDPVGGKTDVSQLAGNTSDFTADNGVIEYSGTFRTLKPNSTYYYRAFVIVNGEIILGEVKNFTTEQTEIKVTTGKSYNVTSNSGTICGEISGWSESFQGTLGFFYSKTDKDPIGGRADVTEVAKSTSEFAVKENGIISFEGNLELLAPNTIYYYRAFVSVNGETILGEVLSFTTSEASDFFELLSSPVYDADKIYFPFRLENAHDLADTYSKVKLLISREPQPTEDNNIFTYSGLNYEFLSSPVFVNGSGTYTLSMPLDRIEFEWGVTYYYTFCLEPWYSNTHPTIYCETVGSFTLETTSGDVIDLGLSVKWASHNLGATLPYEYGDLVGWGDPTGKHVEDPMDYEIGKRGDIYCYYGYYKTDDTWDDLKLRLNISNTEWDVAKAQWGNGWRLPTKDELSELLEKCTWRRIRYKGIDGQRVIGPNNNDIFLPCAGVRYGENIGTVGETGYYWSGTAIDELFTNGAYALEIGRMYKDDIDVYTTYFGRSVRPVR